MDNSSFHDRFKNFLSSIPLWVWSLITIILYSVFTNYGHDMTGSIFLFIFSIYFILKNKGRINKNIIYTIASFSSVFILFISRIISYHYFNNKYEIEPEYLNFSVTIFSFITAITLSPAIILFCVAMVLIGISLFSRRLELIVTLLALTLSALNTISYLYNIFDFMSKNEILLLSQDAYTLTAIQTACKMTIFARINQHATR